MYKRIFTLNYDGKIPSKKNQTRFTMGKGRGGKGFPRAYSSKEYKDFVLDMDSQFISQMDYPDEPLGLIHIEFEFRYASNRRTDSDNKVSAILDALQEISIIEDDRWQLVPNFTVKSEKSFRDGCTIKIMELENE